MDFQVINLIGDSRIGTAIRESDTLFSIFEFVHVLAISMVFGSVVAVDSRMIGIAWKDRSLSRIESDVLPYTWGAFALAVLAGSLMFTAHAVEYMQNPYFLIKMGLIVLAGVNMLIFHFVTSRDRASWNNAKQTPFKVKFAGVVSILLWIGAIGAGRWIGFYLDQVHFG